MNEGELTRWLNFLADDWRGKIKAIERCRAN